MDVDGQEAASERRQTFKMLYFASASSYTRKSSELLDAPLRCNQLFTLLEDKYHGIKEKVLDSCLLTVNLEYIDLDQQGEILINPGDEVAVIPPVSSG